MKRAIIGFVVGVLLTGASGIWLLNRQAEEPLIFPRETFYAGQPEPGGGFVMFSGAVMGEGVGYPNNYFEADCWERDRECRILTMQEIGHNHVSQPDEERWPIVRWEPDLIVVRSEPPPQGCSRVILNILRRTEEVQYIREPINHTSPNCQNAEMRLFRWSIGQTLWWRRMEERNG